MTRDDIIRMMRELAGPAFANASVDERMLDEWMPLFRAVAEAEREAVLKRFQNEIDHSYLNNMRMVPAFGRIKGDRAVRVDALEAIIEGIRAGVKP